MNRGRRYFVCSVGEAGAEYEEDNFRRCENLSGHFMHRDTTHKGVFDEVCPGDVVFLKRRQSLLAYGEVTECRDDDPDGSLDGWSARILVKKWIWKDPANHYTGTALFGIAGSTLKGDQYATVKEVRPSYALEKARNINPDSSLYKIMTAKTIDSYVQLLKASKNLILHGAPGTGKTFLAKEIAKVLGDGYGFVQFHPSYDYTDFVEGLRPLKSAISEGPVGFEIRPGIFKSFCEKALKNIQDSRKNSQQLTLEKSIEQKYGQLVEKINSGELESIPQRTGKSILLSVNSKGSIEGTAEKGSRSHTIPLHTILLLAAAFPSAEKLNLVGNIYKEFSAIASGCYSSGCWAVLNRIFKELPADSSTEIQMPVNKKDFVFIIDEINRAEMSKVLGELFFSIDPGYRGVAGRIRTQYANMADEPNIFDEEIARAGEKEDSFGWFFIPDNVYIIGTMNDVDRSVDRMDFAFRRRFAFQEISAEDRSDMLDGLKEADELKKRMNALNKAISSPEVALGDDYHVGPAYFLKFENYKEHPDPFRLLWDFHLEGLLKEYLRGIDRDGSRLDALRKVYFGHAGNDGQ